MSEGRVHFAAALPELRYPFYLADLGYVVNFEMSASAAA